MKREYTTPADWIHLFQGDCRDGLSLLDNESVKCCITSPPYWGVSDYPLPPVQWKDGMHTLAKEPDFNTYADHILEVLDAVWPKMTPDGIIWLIVRDDDRVLDNEFELRGWTRGVVDLGPEQVYCLGVDPWFSTSVVNDIFVGCFDALSQVKPWELFQPYIGYRFGKTPRTLALPMIFASTLPGQVLLDPFSGVGTLGLFALETGRRAVLIEADPSACEIARVRLARGM